MPESLPLNPVAAPSAPAPWRPPAPLPNQYQTERLILRHWLDADAAALFEAVNQSRADMIPWLPWATYDHLTLAQSVYNIEKWRRECETDSPARDNFVLGVIDRRTGEVLGGTGLHRIIHGAHEAEIGYWVRSSRTRQGVCTEATRGLISWAFTPPERGGWGLRRLHIRCCSLNAASKAVPTKIGLRAEVHIKEDRWLDGIGWADTLGWGVVASEWDVDRHELRA